MADIVTPNVKEAAALLGDGIMKSVYDMPTATKLLHDLQQMTSPLPKEIKTVWFYCPLDDLTSSYHNGGRSRKYDFLRHENIMCR
ncbi:thiamine biosynthetic bifunctional enzyme TH1 chloroplastic-like [Trifolium pratense]|uniref:Thiamine biosynthetic bifunctional enzyme TH1 chloroplastic-like n=1 Tax=Trifolium pratense TaxID=57577 RepID=A0A2K3NF66_TRIPR|nr:thiamine biosynthetic bifunctional enzyme TH1 chloroplastic-like [Trifolium pratense]